MLTKRDYEEWEEQQEVEYTLSVRVNGEFVAKATSSMVDDVIAKANSLTGEVAQFLMSEYQDGDIDWDAIADDMAESAGYNV